MSPLAALHHPLYLNNGVLGFISIRCQFQDVVHVAVKLKSQLLKPSIILPMGSYVAAGHHVRMLQIAFGKDQHGLREREVLIIKTNKTLMQF